MSITFDLCSSMQRSSNLLVLSLFVCGPILSGCWSSPATPLPSAASAVSNASSGGVFEYAEVELSSPKLRIDAEGLCWFEVNYKFVKGQPAANYVLTVRFPETRNACIKEISGWQLRSEGIIKDGFALQEPTVSKFEMILSEAEVPMSGYTDISNKLTGTYQPEESP